MRGVVGLVVGLLLLGAWQLSESTQRGNRLAAPPAADVGRPREAREATVVRIVDGDTLILRAVVETPGLPAGTETRVRLLEVDTPESVEPGRPLQCYARRASAELARLAPPGSIVSVMPDRDLLDPYGRTLLYLWNDHGAFVNLQLVRTGAARTVLYEPNDRYIDVLRHAERQARAAGTGLWGSCGYFGAPALSAGRQRL